MYFRHAFTLLTLALALGLSTSSASARERRVTVAVLDMGESPTAARVAERLAKRLASFRIKETTLSVLDRGMSAAAARGAGYAGSLNLTLADARALGAAVGCDFYLTGDAQTIRRSPSSLPVYFESYATVFVVSARTGRLVNWDRLAIEADDAAQAERSILAALDGAAEVFATVAAEAAEREERERFEPPAPHTSVIDLSTEEGAAVPDLREPAPYRSLRPAYTIAASDAEAEATVDVLAEIGADGRAGRVEVVRWAGFGLDEEVVSTVRRMNFRPAERDGERVAVRVLLRYNFRRPQKTPNR